jgi:hypothetical protein
MKVKEFLVMGLLSLLFGCKSNGQSQLIDITSKSEEGFCDIILNIVDKQIDNDFWIITAKGQYKGTIVGIKIKVKNGLKPGIVNGEIDKTAFTKDAVEISSIGNESDSFIKVLSNLYGFKTNKKFTSKPLIFTCISLSSTEGFLDKGYFKFKLFFDDTDEKGLYSEIYLNPNFPEGLIELPEKDPGYRKNIINAMTK